MLTIMTGIFTLVVFMYTLYKGNSIKNEALPKKPDYHAIEAAEREILGDEFETIVKWDIEVFGVYAHACPGCADCTRKATIAKETYNVMKRASDTLPYHDDYMLFCGMCGYPQEAHENYYSCERHDVTHMFNTGQVARPFHVPSEATSIEIEDGSGNTITRVWTWYERGEKMSYKEHPVSYQMRKEPNRAPEIPTITSKELSQRIRQEKREKRKARVTLNTGFF
jgi:hypothetical protein